MQIPNKLGMASKWHVRIWLETVTITTHLDYTCILPITPYRKLKDVILHTLNAIAMHLKEFMLNLYYISLTHVHIRSYF